MKKKAKYIIAVLFLLLSIAYTCLVKFYDVGAIVPNGSEVGFAKINTYFLEIFKTNSLLYQVSDMLGKLTLGIVGIFGLTGFIQLVSRRSFKKVDKEIYALGGLYVVTFGLYVFFEKFIINYRPIIMSGETELEASYPSSHTMLACVILGSTIFVLDHFLKNKSLKRALQLICWCFMLALIASRMLSGVHWFTDIVGGVIISLTLVLFFIAIISKDKKKEEFYVSEEDDMKVFETFGQKYNPTEVEKLKDEVVNEQEETVVLKEENDDIDNMIIEKEETTEMPEVKETISYETKDDFDVSMYTDILLDGKEINEVINEEPINLVQIKKIEVVDDKQHHEEIVEDVPVVECETEKPLVIEIKEIF